ncbi:hypothetical protein ACTTAL_03420 [Rhodobacter capsulatus]|uniref:hypothetical protein n=1 Tax=Rhodobacter capsulatus TaxID=1061 RepID=UPI0003D30081|nr:hypothetical protein [Rhodobacter capsulatus]ETD89943.1 hypothetical protein U713_07485 [Rhodobacter capsulatus YW2]
MAETDGLVLPVGLTEKQLLQQVARIESRMAKMETQTTQSFVRANAKIAQSFKGIETAAAGMSNSTKAALQNMGFQVQDIMTQVAGGTDLSRALSMQLPQMLGGLGLVGVAAGTLAPLIIGVGAAIFSSGNDAKAAEEQMKRLAAALSEVQNATKATQQSLPDLMEQFGPENVAQARQMLEIQRELAQVNLARELSGAADMIGAAQLGGFEEWGTATAAEWQKAGEAADAYFAKLDAANGTFEVAGITKQFGNTMESLGVPLAALEHLKEMFGMTYAEAGKLAAAMVNLRDAGGPQEQAQAAAALREALSGALGNMDGASEEAIKLVEQLLKVEDAALRAAAADIAGAITPAANEAARLADELARAVTNAINLGAQGISSLRQAQINYDFRDDPTGRAAALAREQFDASTAVPSGAPPEVTAQIEEQRRAFVGAAVATEEYRQRLIEWQKEEAKAAKGGGGGKGSKGRADAYQTALDRMAGDTDAAKEQIEAMKSITASGRGLATQLQIIAERQKLLNAAQRAGIEITPEVRAQIDATVAAYVDANSALREMQGAAKRGEDAMSDLFGSILDGADAAKSAFANLLLEIAKAQFSKGLMSLLSAAGGDWLVTGIGSLIGANANGTPNWRGGLTSINERGGEIIDLPTGARVYPHDVSMRMAEKAGSGSSTRTENLHVTAEILENGNLAMFVRDQAGRVVAQAAPKIVSQSVASTGRAMRATKAFGG